MYDVIYRPPEARYWVLESDHFEVIFEEGLEEEAREAAAVLESQVPATQALAGSSRRLQMPVVLNRFNDRSNGYVTPLPFKQEIEGTAIKGNRLSARFASWMWAVTPHELVHAVHADAGNGLGVGAVTRWFAPDAARSLNFLMPPGISEGAAVYHESRIQPGAGRLNFSLFQMQFRAAMLSEEPWSLAQMLEVPRYEVPANRYYIGGANVFRFLAERHGERFFRRALNFHYRFPFLGFGWEVWHGTGVPPWRLGRQVRAAMQEREQDRLDHLGPLTQPQVLASAEGRRHRRPRWIDDRTLVAYVSGYATRPGFYRIDAWTGERTPLAYHAITEDFYYSLNADTTALLYARYVPDPLVTIQALGEAFRLDLRTGEVEGLTEGGRVVAPVETEAAVWALRNDGQFTEWVRVEPDGSITPLSNFDRTLLLHLVPSPDGSVVAAVVNKAGHQGLYRLEREGGRVTAEPWLAFDEASILDATWSADGRYLLFTADPGETANIYAFEPATDRVWKLTHVAFGALEPSLSPDGATLAYIHYRHERYDLALQPFDLDRAEPVPREATQATGETIRKTPVRYEGGALRPYEAGSHLRPRMVYPSFYYETVSSEAEDADLGLGIGLAVQGADPLERWAYAAEGYVQDGRAWGRMSIQSGRSFLRPYVSAYDVASTAPVAVVDDEGNVVRTQRVGREERGVAAGASVPVILSSDVFTTQARFSLRAALEQERLFDREGETLRAFRSRVRLSPSALLAYRVQANERDLLPNTGISVSAAASIDAWQEGIPRRSALITQTSLYYSLSARRHTGLRLVGATLSQTRGSVFNLDTFVPRGYENDFLGRGSFVKLGLEMVQPLRFIEDGLVIVPIYAKVLYTYGFAETLLSAGGAARRASLSSAGAGMGLQVRLFYVLDLDLRVGAAFRLEDKKLEATYR